MGENPATGLWEFAHLQSGTEPALGPDGRVKRSPEGHLTPTPETGMVLVLLPGGRVPKADSPGQSQEDWITTVDLVPFFLSKYELTAEQWDRLFLRRGHSREEGKSLAPASAISWDDISLMWHREFGWCDFPSETQWEYACRGGTTSTWWTGNDAKDLRGVANIENEQNAAARILPVGTLRANAFGLHDVHGNVREWCRSIPPPRGSGSGLRPFRGGGGYDSAWNSRAAHSVSSPPGFYREHYGLRPFRRITP